MKEKYRVTATIDGKRQVLIIVAPSRFAVRQRVLWLGQTVIVHSVEATS